MRREKLKAKSTEFLDKEKERLAKWRINMKQDKERYDKFKENDKLKKWMAKKNKEKEVIVLEAVNAEVLAQGETSTLICLKAPIKRQKSYQGWQQSTNFESICSKIVEDLARS